MQKITSKILSWCNDIWHYITTKPIALRCPRYVWEDKEYVEEYKQKIQEELWVEYLIIPDQTHSDICCEVTRENISENFWCDALYTKERNLSLFVLASDCVPILFYNDKLWIIWVIHAGWKGLQSEIIKNTFWEISQKNNLEIQDFSVYIWPHICQSCYEIWEEVANNFREKYSACISENRKAVWKYFLDTWAIAIKQLKKLGMQDSQIEYSELCTYEEKELLHSYRRKTHTGEENYGNNGFGIWLK